MAQFDIISAAAKAYKTTWAERRYLLRLAAIPFLIKLVCFVLAATFAKEDDQYLRFMLIMVPGLLAEGWMLSHYTRLLVIGHRWPFRATGDFDSDMAILAVRARGVLSGMIVYVLINMALGLLMAMVGQIMMPYLSGDDQVAQADIPPPIMMFSAFMLGFLFWGFRLLWLYIPFAVNADAKPYLLALRGLSSSLYMIGLWLICFAPAFFVLRILGGFIGGLLSVSIGDGASSLVLILMTVLADTVKSLLATAGMTYALMNIFGAERKDRA